MFLPITYYLLPITYDLYFMKITEDEVRHIAELSRLALSGDELLTYSAQLNTIILHVEQLNTLDTTGIGQPRMCCLSLMS